MSGVAAVLERFAGVRGGSHIGIHAGDGRMADAPEPAVATVPEPVGTAQPVAAPPVDLGRYAMSSTSEELLT